MMRKPVSKELKKLLEDVPREERYAMAAYLIICQERYLKRPSDPCFSECPLFYQKHDELAAHLSFNPAPRSLKTDFISCAEYIFAMEEKRVKSTRNKKNDKIAQKRK